MSEEIMDQELDFFNDADMAEAENLPVGSRYIGYVSKVDTSQSLPGAFKTVKLRTGITREVPEIGIDITAVGKVGEGKFDPESNYYKTSSLRFWIGKEDRIGRHSLARLVQQGAGVSDEEMKMTPIREAVTKLDKAYLTFEVKHRKFATRSGGEGTAQDFIKIKPATVEEIAEVQ